MDLVIFSRNRPLQLYALLESIDKYFDSDSIHVTVLHRYDSEYSKALEEVADKFNDHEFIDELNPSLNLTGHGFKKCMQELLTRSGRLIAFLTDDIIFKGHVDVRQISELMNAPSVLAFSLRLGLHISECYALNQSQPVPAGSVWPPNIFAWLWKQSQMDWQYPFSVDGHVFRKSQFSEWVAGLDYHHPNSFEEKLQECRKFPGIPEVMLSHVVSRLVNLPINRVQETHQNRCGSTTSEFLLSKWNKGLCLDIDHYHGLMNRGVHEELELIFKER